MSTAFATPPAASSYWLRDAAVPLCLLSGFGGELRTLADGDGLVRVHIRIGDGCVQAVTHGQAPESGEPALDLAGGQVWPCFIDVHTHLEMSHSWPRMENPDGSLASAVRIVQETYPRWNLGNARARTEFSLRCCHAHGTRAVRTYVPSRDPQTENRWALFAALRESWAGRVDMQLASLVPLAYFMEDECRRLVDVVAEHGGILGCSVFPMPQIDAALDRVFAFAAQRGLDLDFHTDETDDPRSDNLRRIADTALRHRYTGKITCGHCCSLALQLRDEVQRTLDRVVEAGIAIVSLPLSNLYLQERAAGRTPRWRGVTLLHEIRARGIPVAVASDNCRDPFHAFGDHDMFEVYMQATRILHLDRPHGDWPRVVTSTPAALMGLSEAGLIGVGRPADLVLFRERGFSELLSRPQADRVVLRAGRAIDTRLPDYRELDPLLAADDDWRGRPAPGVRCDAGVPSSR